jgi:hypothetical protein
MSYVILLGDSLTGVAWRTLTRCCLAGLLRNWKILPSFAPVFPDEQTSPPPSLLLVVLNVITTVPGRDCRENQVNEKQTAADLLTTTIISYLSALRRIGELT